MFLSSETLTALIALGAPPEKLAAVLRMIEADAEAVTARAPRSDSKGAERMRRYRDRRVANGMSPKFDGYLYADRLRERDGDLCVYCQEAEGDTVDHITPISRGGTDDFDNLALACNACNGGKAGREPVGRYEPKSATARAAHVRYVRSCSPEHSEHPEQTPSLSPSPQTPQPHTHPRGDIYTPPAKGPTPTEIARGFVAFWAAYPKRVGKDAAAKSFASAMKRADAAEPLAVILAGLERALPGWDDPQFIPNPATWLNQGRWADDAPQPRALGGPQNAKPDKLTARHDNYAASWAGAEQASGILAARRAL